MVTRRYAWSLLTIVAVLLIAAVWYRGTSSRRHARMVEQAIEALDAQRLDEADAFLRAALILKPSDVQARYLLAQTHHQQGNLEAALAELQQVPADYAQAEFVQVQMAVIHLAQNRPGEAEKLLRECITRFPRSVAARQHLLDVLGLQLREREMLALLDELWELALHRPVMDRVWVLAKCLNVRFIHVKDEDIWPGLQAFTRQEPDNLHTQVAAAKFRLHINADVLDAAQSLENCLAKSPKHIEAIAALTSHYVEHGGPDYGRIEDLLDRWSAAPDHAAYWQTLADWQVRKGSLADALDSYERARQLDPSEWRTPHKMGLLTIRLAKQAAVPNESLIAKGQLLLDEAETLKETRSNASGHFEYLQNWLTEAPTNAATSRSFPIEQLAEIAAFCESVQDYTDALRWCDLIQKVVPLESRTLAIRQRVCARRGLKE